MNFSSKKVWLILLLAFLFRLGFGLALPFWPADQLQTYLLGLKSFTTHTWPYFGPDLAGSETTYINQIPGAFEGLVVGLPFYVLPIPEAPFVCVNLLSLFAICLLTWYFSKKLTNLSPWFIFASLVVLPWSLHESTGMITRSWCLFGCSIFFVGFFEALPEFTLGIIPAFWANAMMGFGTFWVMQFHMSWMYLVSFFGLSLILQWRHKHEQAGKSLLYYVIGSIPSAIFILPTLIKYSGIPSGYNGHGFTVPFNVSNFKEFFTILARYFSLASFEMPFFLDPPGSAGFSSWGAANGPDFVSSWMGPSTHARIQFLMGSPITLILGGFLWIVGLVQPVVMLGMWFYKRNESKDWVMMRWLVLFNVFIIWVSFWFTMKWPLSHILYDSTFPLVFFYSLYCWNRLAPSANWRNFAKVYLVAAFIFQAVYAWRVLPIYSIYTDRDRIVQAIQQHNYHLVGERREFTYY